MNFFSKFRKIKQYFFLGFFVMLVMQFNNCNSINSQRIDQASNSGSTTGSSTLSGSGENTPVSPLSPYVLRCITSSDGVKVAAVLKASVTRTRNVSISGKLTALDWSQDEDLIITLDNACIRESNFTDPMLDYVDAARISSDMPLTVYVIKKESVTQLGTFIAKSLASDCLQAAEKNLKLKLNADVSDPRFTDQTHLSHIGASEAFISSLMTYNAGALYKTKVAVIDSGVDVFNPDLIDSMARDTNGFVVGYNSTGLTTDFSDLGFHGTHVAGLIGAGFHNGISGSGVWGRNIVIYPVRAFQLYADGELGANAADVANGIMWAANKNVDLINMSLGSPAESLVIKNAISFAISKNVTIVVAAGNDGALLDSTNPQYPAMHSVQFNGLITVGSIDASSGARSSFSNYSSSYVDLLAPGSNSTLGILSTVPVALTSNGSGFASKITTSLGVVPIHGTSMAAPIVTGALASAISLAKARSINFTNAQLETFLNAEGTLKNAGYSSFSFRGNYLHLPTLIAFIKLKIDEAIAIGNPPAAFTITEQPTNKQAVVLERLSVNVNHSGGAGAVYQWYQNDQKVTAARSRILTFNQLQETQAGSYYVTITAGSTTLTSQKIEVKVAQKYCN